jgi:hypothetical protein
MRKLNTLFIVTLLGWMGMGLVSQAHAGCRVFRGELEYEHEGYPIRYELAVFEILREKKYVQVAYPEDADYWLSLELEAKQKGHFQFTTAKTQWRVAGTERPMLESYFEKRCWTDLCSTGDFRSPLEKSLKKLKAELPECRQ